MRADQVFQAYHDEEDHDKEAPAGMDMLQEGAHGYEHLGFLMPRERDDLPEHQPEDQDEPPPDAPPDPTINPMGPEDLVQADNDQEDYFTGTHDIFGVAQEGAPMEKPGADGQTGVCYDPPDPTPDHGLADQVELAYHDEEDFILAVPDKYGIAQEGAHANDPADLEHQGDGYEDIGAPDGIGHEKRLIRDFDVGEHGHMGTKQDLMLTIARVFQDGSQRRDRDLMTKMDLGSDFSPGRARLPGGDY
jgi:hypothetical protein